LDDLHTPDLSEHQHGFTAPTLEGGNRSNTGFRGAFPDLKLIIDDLAAVGNNSWARITARGTQRVPFTGMPPTGRIVEISVIDI
jgi:predicted ester cyclase